MIAIIDYGAGNIKSVEKAFDFLGTKTILTADKDIILNSDKVVLPGVGAFGDAMELLNASGLSDTIKEVVKNQIPFLGICLGMQMMFEKSEEGVSTPGLGIFKGEIKRFKETEGYKIPHIGWNEIKINKDSRLFNGISENPFVYFVHSYYLDAFDKNIVAATCDYINTFDAGIESGNTFACQFHPEKSGSVGLKILKNFAEI